MKTHPKAIVTAMGANLVAASSKLATAFFSGSLTMLSEGVHPLVDAAAQCRSDGGTL